MNGTMKNVRTIEDILEVSNENTVNLIPSRTLHHSDNYNANIITCYRKKIQLQPSIDHRRRQRSEKVI